MPKVYSVDVKIYATAYIRADSEDEARKIAAALKLGSLELRTEDYAGESSDGTDIAISGAQFDSDALPDLSLSPAMTIYGPDDDADFECVHDDAEPVAEPDLVAEK